VIARYPNCTSIATPMNGRNIANAPPMAGAAISSIGHAILWYTTLSFPGSAPPSTGIISAAHLPLFQ
jgi:hypothetical protein